MASPAPAPSAPKKKLPVVAAAPAKAERARAGGWAAFTDGGTVPAPIVAARVVLVLALAATVPTILGVRHGNRLLWTVGIAALPLFWIVAGYHVWRRICPLAVVGQLGRLLGRPGTRKVSGWLAERYLLFQFGLLVAALALRLIATNGSATWLAGFLIVVVIAAALVSFVYGGKTWCNVFCPVGVVEKLYTEPSAKVAGGPATSQCAPCVACKKHCPDIDLEQGYWKEMHGGDRRLVYFAWPGVVVAFYAYFWLCAGTWAYYFDGSWAYERTLPASWLDPGFHFAHAVPRVAAAPLTLVVGGLASYALFAAVEHLLWRRRGRGLDGQAADEARGLLRHQLLVVAGLVAFNAFYFFAGQPSLRRLPGWAVHGWSVAVVFASAAIFFRRFRRRESEHVQEKFAQKILKKWEWGDAPPSDDLSSIYLLHHERTRQREARLRAYKETVRELVADGLVTRAELVILDSLRAQLGITDKDHAKVVDELSAEERQLFDPAYQGSVEQRLKGEQYRRELERLVIDAARAGGVPAPASLEALRASHGIAAAEHAAELARVVGADGPLARLLTDELAAIARLGATVAACGGRPADGHESASLAFVAHVARCRGGEHVARVLGLYAARHPVAELARARAALAARPADGAEIVGELREVLPADEHGALTTAVAALAAPPTALAAGPLLAVADDASRYLRAAIALVLSRFDEPEARAALIRALDDAEPIVRQAAIRALGARSRLTRELLQKALSDGDARVRQAAVRAVAGNTGDHPALSATAMAQTVRGVGNAGVYATLDVNARVDSLIDIEKLVLLRGVPMFADLSPEDLEDLAGEVIEQHLPPGAVLCREGDAGDAVFLIVKGAVKVYTGGGDRPERVLSELGAGACLGEMAVFDAAPRSATVEAVVPTRVLVLPGADFKGLLAERGDMAQAIIAELVRRMRGLMAAR